MTRRLLIVIVALAWVSALFLAREWWLMPHGTMIVRFFDVGQGDSAFLVTPSGRQVMIDGGPDRSALERLGQSMPFFDRSIDLLVMSHPQQDHMFSFPDILRRYRVGAVLMTGVHYHLPRYHEFLSLLQEQHIPVLIADPAKDIDLGDGVTLDIIWPPPVLMGRDLPEVNNSSIVLRAMFHGHAVLFTGDMETVEENEVLASGADVRADVLKVPHHGSHTSSSTGFLLAVRPDLAVISCGAHNTYGHPHRDILDRYRHFGIPVKVTAVEGAVTVRFE